MHEHPSKIKCLKDVFFFLHLRATHSSVYYGCYRTYDKNRETNYFWYIFYHSVHWHGAFNNHRIELFKQLVCQKPNRATIFDFSLHQSCDLSFFVVEKPVLLWQLLSQIISKCSLGISCWIMRQNMILHRLLGRNAAIISTILCFYDCLRSV